MVSSIRCHPSGNEIPIYRNDFPAWRIMWPRERTLCHQNEKCFSSSLQATAPPSGASKFVPGGLSYQPTRPPALTDEYDDWLARA